jgi:amino acid permease
MAGAGVLGLPETLEESGWTGIILLVVVCFMSCYTAKILVKCMSHGSKDIRTYQDIGKAAFGEAGFVWTLIFQNLTLLFVGTLYLILGGKNAYSLITDWGQFTDPTLSELHLWYFITGTAVLVWPFIVGLKTMKEISWVAVFGMSATTLTVVVICVCSVLYGNIHRKDQVFFNAQQIPYAFSVFLFAFGGHNVFPAIQESMENKDDYDKMMNVSFILTLLLYLPPSILAYLCYGSEVQSPVLLSLGKGIPAQVATIAITLHIWLTIPIVNNPLNLWIEEWVASRFKYSNKYISHNFLSRFIIRTMVLALQTVIACSLPFFGDIMAFIGASTVSATIFIFPCFFYLKLKWAQIKLLEKIWVFIVLLLATIGSAVGLYTAVVGLVTDVSQNDFSLPDCFFYVIIGCLTYFSIMVIGVCTWKLYENHRLE